MPIPVEALLKKKEHFERGPDDRRAQRGERCEASHRRSTSQKTPSSSIQVTPSMTGRRYTR